MISAQAPPDLTGSCVVWSILHLTGYKINRLSLVPLCRFAMPYQRRGNLGPVRHWCSWQSCLFERLNSTFAWSNNLIVLTGRLLFKRFNSFCCQESVCFQHVEIISGESFCETNHSKSILNCFTHSCETGDHAPNPRFKTGKSRRTVKNNLAENSSKLNNIFSALIFYFKHKEFLITTVLPHRELQSDYASDRTYTMYQMYTHCTEKYKLYLKTIWLVCVDACNFYLLKMYLLSHKLDTTNKEGFFWRVNIISFFLIYFY